MDFSNDIVVGLGLEHDRKHALTEHFKNFTSNLFSLPVRTAGLAMPPLIIWDCSLNKKCCSYKFHQPGLLLETKAPVLADANEAQIHD